MVSFPRRNCVVIVFARESNDRSNLVFNLHHRDCHPAYAGQAVHYRELAMTEVDILGTAPPAFAGQASQSEAARFGIVPYSKNVF
jgi:hypothetical protein